jgi:hypothetical protein
MKGEYEKGLVGYQAYFIYILRWGYCGDTRIVRFIFS